MPLKPIEHVRKVPLLLHSAGDSLKTSKFFTDKIGYMRHIVCPKCLG